MDKISISPLKLIPDMQIAETIFNEYGAVIISEGSILDEHMISKLKNLDIISVKVFKKENDKVQPAYAPTQEFKARYNEDVNAIREVMGDISSGKNIDLEKVQSVVNSVIVRINEKLDVVRCINQLRNTDEYTYAHSLNVSLLSMLIGKWLKMKKERITTLIQAALLHDIGKVKVPQDILNKPGKLTSEEYEEIKKHSLYGYRLLVSIPNIDKDVALAVLMHHEKINGSGYPMGVKGDKISDLAKIITVADIYDAMTSNRVYRDKESPFEVFSVIEEKKSTELDTVVVNAFLSNLAAYYIGDHVKLNTGDIAEIVYINPSLISRPVIRINDKYVDLGQQKEIKILEIV